MRRVAGISGGIAALVLLLWGAFHLMIPWVNPQQESPDGHPSSACWACHIVVSSAETIELDAQD